MRRGGLVLAGAVMAMLSAAPPLAAQAPLSPVEIYGRTRDAVTALPLAPYVLFTEQNHSTVRYALFQDRLRMLVRQSDGNAYVRVISDSTGNPSRNPAKVITDGRAPTTIVRVGDFPLADFGLRRTPAVRPGIFEASGTPEPAADSGPAVIGHIVAANLPYRIVDLGDANEAGRPVYHLGLTPLRDAGHHVLRELWIDRETFLPHRLVAERFVEDGPITFRYLIDVTCDVLDGHLVNTSAGGHFDTHLAWLFKYSGDSLWTISEVSFPADPPSWVFEPDAVARHRGERVEGVDAQPSPTSTARTKS